MNEVVWGVRRRTEGGGTTAAVPFWVALVSGGLRVLSGCCIVSIGYNKDKNAIVRRVFEGWGLSGIYNGRSPQQLAGARRFCFSYRARVQTRRSRKTFCTPYERRGTEKLWLA